ncbi:chorismate mutase [Mycolicibacterium goodii]|uniref:Chorismate mutase n=1 Tax=Mycolicibacterium goodii TaxID=134601 RepID=A0ABS6HJX3_MYCGD|nr:chorismate mutase [Mycolicibacterium goodii]MBU8810049.1 chorismate mutase [Mycolicibacterium goodii]MBU8818421.1 chorismate mutase [Mycolicibacterium goodii]MBU8821994.1 chorismate mutase [Mycolicibacterium goodii]MBU8828488.1 chorismate mutase [Mycolicibacterium goodii]MBU8838774.1 chorismate mutase [Mycolicibacterium goodii]
MRIAAQRFVVALVTAALGVAGAVTPAHAEDGGPLYKLVDTAVQRLQTADPVSASKWVNGGSIEDSARANQVLEAVAADANKRGLDESFVRRAFENQIHATEGVEYTRFAQWKFDPAHAPKSAPDLTRSRAAIDEFNREMVAEMAAQRGVLMSGDCARALTSARAAVTAARSLDPLYQQALGAATASYCP